MTADRPQGEPFEVLVLALEGGALGTVEVALRASHVGEVARDARITAYPGAPTDVRGVAAVRGQVVPVLDLAPPSGGARAVVLVRVGAGALALAGATPTRVAAAVAIAADAGAEPNTLRTWSGRVLPLAGAVRLADAARPQAADGPTLPLLDAAALIHDVVDDPDDER